MQVGQARPSIFNISDMRKRQYPQSLLNTATAYIAPSSVKSQSDTRSKPLIDHLSKNALGLVNVSTKKQQMHHVFASPSETVNLNELMQSRLSSFGAYSNIAWSVNQNNQIGGGSPQVGEQTNQLKGSVFNGREHVHNKERQARNKITQYIDQQDFPYYQQQKAQRKAKRAATANILNSANTVNDQKLITLEEESKGGNESTNDFMSENQALYMRQSDMHSLQLKLR